MSSFKMDFQRSFFLMYCDFFLLCVFSYRHNVKCSGHSSSGSHLFVVEIGKAMKFMYQFF